MNFHYDPAYNVLVYPRHELIERHIQEARPVGAHHVGVPRTLRNCQILRWFNFPVMPVIGEDYDWPRMPGITPYEKQVMAANFMVLHPRCFNLSDMGAGKTLTTLWAADWLMRQHAPGTFRALIVCPLSIMQRVWGDGIFKNFLARRTYKILYGDAQKRVKLLEEPADFYVCNVDGVGVGAHTRGRLELDGFSAELARREDIRLCVVDEASCYKDATTKRHRLARQIIGKRDYLWLLTGTPTPNAPTDAYGLAKLVNNAYGKSFTTFEQETMVKVSQFRWIPHKDGYERARRLLSPSIRVDIRDIWDAPDMTTQQREVPLTPDQKKAMDDLKKNLQVTLQSGQPISAANEAAARQKFIQISLGAVYDQDHRAHFIDAKPRFEELKAVTAEAPAKTLIFAPLTSIVSMLHKEIGKIRRCALVNGDTPQKERAEIFRRFQDEDDPTDIIADPGCMAHGLDLWQARSVIWYGPTDKTELYLQANKRAHRPGQNYPVTVVQIVSNPLEREIYRRLENNESLQGALLDAVKRGDF